MGDGQFTEVPLPSSAEPAGAGPPPDGRRRRGGTAVVAEVDEPYLDRKTGPRTIESSGSYSNVPFMMGPLLEI